MLVEDDLLPLYDHVTWQIFNVVLFNVGLSTRLIPTVNSGESHLTGSESSSLPITIMKLLVPLALAVVLALAVSGA